MARGKRATFVAQASLVWALTNEDTTPASLEHYIETGRWEKGGGRANVMPYNPAVLQAIQDSGTFFGGRK